VDVLYDANECVGKTTVTDLYYGLQIFYFFLIVLPKVIFILWWYSSAFHCPCFRILFFSKLGYLGF